MEEINGKKYYTTNEIIEKIGIAKSTLFRYIKQGRIEVLGIKGKWLISEEGLEKFLTPQVFPSPIRTPKTKK